jgi:hypothetical protein
VPPELPSPLQPCAPNNVLYMANVIYFHHTTTFSRVGGVYISYIQVFWEIFEYSKSLVIDIDLIALYAKLAHITQNLNIFKHIRDIPFALK